MFETSSVQARAATATRKVSFLTASIALHSAVVIAMIASSIAHLSFPKEAPNQFATPFIVSAPPPPPAAPAAPARRAATPQAVAPTQRVTAPVQPPTIPDVAVPVEAGPVANGGGIGDGDPNAIGDPNGVPGGIDGGVAGGTGTQPVPVEPEQTYVAGGEVKAPVILTRVEPRYPQLAIQARKSGLVVLQCTINRDGRIRDVQVLRSTFPAFDQPAIDAVRQWTFAPGTLHGRPVDTTFFFTVNFTLSRN